MAVQSNNNSLVQSESALGIENRNFLSPVGFKFAIDKMRGVDFFCQAASIPSVSMNTADQFTRFNKIPQPGDELVYEPLQIRFLIDENLKNWYQVHDWMREVTTPYSSKEFGYKRTKLDSQNDKDTNDKDWRSDCSLFILSSNYKPVAEFVFRNAFPINLTTLNFDASNTDIQYFTAECQLAYSHYDHFIYEAANATDASMAVNYRRTENGAEISGI